MKRFLSMLLVLVMVFSMIPQAAFAAEEYIVSGTPITEGTNNVTLDPNASTTVFAFDTTEKAIYTFSVDSGFVGYWGGNEFFLTNPNSTSVSIEMECIVGPTYYIGVTGAGSCALTVTKTGEAKPDPVTTEYKNVHTPSAAKMACYTVDGTGEALVVNFNLDAVNLNGMLGAPTSIKALADNKYDYIDYRPALEAYGAAAKECGNYYMLTDELAMILNDLYVDKSWDTLLSSVSDLYVKATVSHTAGEAVVEDGFSKVSCTVCGALISSEEIAAEKTLEEQLAEAAKLANGEYLPYETTIEGKVSKIASPYSAQYGNISFYVDVDGTSVYCYRVKGEGMDTLAVGDTVKVVGSLTAYNGSAQFDKTAVVTVLEKAPAITVPETLEEQLAEAAELANGEYLPYATTIEGKVSEIKYAYSAQYNNISFYVDVDGTSVYCYRVTGEGMDTLAVGDTVKVVGSLTAYNGSAQFDKTAAVTILEKADVVVIPETLEEQLAEAAELENYAYLPYITTIEGEVSEIKYAYSEQYGNISFYVDVDGISVYCYRVTGEGMDTLAVGDTVKVEGKLTAYNGTPQFDKNAAVTVVAKAGCAHDLVHMEAVAAGCHYTGNVEHWYCTKCETVWTDEDLTQISNHLSVIIPAIGGEVEHVAESCWNVEYWTCSECEKYWLDEALTQLTNSKSVNKAEASHNLKHVAESCYNTEYWTCGICETYWADEALTQITNSKNVIKAEPTHELEHVAESCYNTEYWTCGICETYWADEALTQITNSKNVIKAEPSHDIVHMDAVEAACHYEGNIEHWYCTKCETVWADEALTEITNHKNVVVPALGGEVVHVEAVAATETENGNIEYWYCEECEQVWADEARTQLTNIKNVIIPALGEEEHKHTLVHVEESCYNIEHWYCEECLVWWQDEALTQVTNSKNVIKAEPTHDIVHVEAVAANCFDHGNIEHWYCTKCETVWADEALTQITNHLNVIVPAQCTNIIHIEAVEPGCHYEGNQEHWYCGDCGTVWADEALLQITNHKNVIIPAKGSNLLVAVDAVEPGCHDDGCIAHWICYECEQVWADEALTQLTNIKNVVLPATGEGEVVHMEAVEPGCHYTGNVEYWHCVDCEKVWTDKALTQLSNIKNVVIPAVGGEVVHVEALEPTCFEPGNVEHWYCEECEQVWTDEALTQLSNHKNVMIAAAHDIEHIEAVAPTCHDDGNLEYWYCAECGYAWTDELLREVTNLKSIIVPATDEGNVVHMEAVEPGCHYTGNVEYWICYDCEKVWTDEALTQLSNIKNVVIPAKESTATKVEAKDPTCSATGNVAYWTCEECEQVWADEALTQLTNIKNVTLAKDKDNHTVEKWVHTCTDKDCDEDAKCTDHKYKGTCTGCDKVLYKTVKATEKHVDKDKDDECDTCGVDLSNAKTGDMIVISVVVMLLAAAAIVVLLTKKRRAA